jgi:hypothetical protein
MTDKEKLEILMKIQVFKLEGWAGVLPNGNIVDRREHPTAIPMQKNTLLGIPEPRQLPEEKGKTLHYLRHDEPSWWGGEPKCDECGCASDLIYDDSGNILCTDCVFEKETNDINQP